MELENLPQFSDTNLVIALIIGFTLVRYLFQAVVHQLLELFTPLPKDRFVKFSESTWKFCYYTIVWLWGVDLVLSQDFFWNTRLIWLGWPHIPLSPAFRLYYLTQMSFYLHSLIAHVTIEVRRGDFLQMFLHHGASAFLIWGSYTIGHHRIGGVLLVLHDVNDIFLELAKQIKYFEYHKLADIVFAIMIISWCITRVLLFPIKVCYSAHSENWNLLGECPMWHVLYSFVIVIQLLDLYWFSLMLQMLYKVIVQKEQIRDTREDLKSD